MGIGGSVMCRRNEERDSQNGAVASSRTFGEQHQVHLFKSKRPQQLSGSFNAFSPGVNFDKVFFSGNLDTQTNLRIFRSMYRGRGTASFL